eukprot:3568875-Rhodomonas_salina.1
MHNGHLQRLGSLTDICNGWEAADRGVWGQGRVRLSVKSMMEEERERLRRDKLPDPEFCATSSHGPLPPQSHPISPPKSSDQTVPPDSTPTPSDIHVPPSQVLLRC